MERKNSVKRVRPAKVPEIATGMKTRNTSAKLPQSKTLITKKNAKTMDKKTVVRRAKSTPVNSVTK